MKNTKESDHLIHKYREFTSGPAPRELKEGVLRTLQNSIPTYPLFFSLAATIFAAGFASALTLFITNSQIKHPPASPPRFLQQETPNPLLSAL